MTAGATTPIGKVLIANRGEIAIRIIRTCRELGIATVAVFSEADTTALHVREADEAILIGPAPALESYLSIPAVLRAAQESGADAVHPGYGFLAENAGFARAVTGAGLVWIGPPADVIALLGDKVASKELARTCHVAVIPGYSGEDQSVDRMLVAATEIGYPVMLKAAAGGGGKGMRTVTSADELPAALDGARREARSAFGDDRIFVEKLIENPRHVEIQILLDMHRHGVYLGERDCSTQRRHQKVVEEAPCPVVTPEIRADMGEAALRLARAAGYVNAGTIEFLFAGDSYYFLEVNTRIQVEHPVTELVTDLDLVRLQFEIAAGRPLALSQNDIQLRGHAIEARLYAEDAAHDFLPSIGKIATFRVPEGPGIRNDVGVAAGDEVTPYYDPMLAKLIVHAETREEAIARLADALDEYEVVGPRTNLPFLRWVVRSETFATGRADIGFVEREWSPAADHQELPVEIVLAAALYWSLAPGPLPTGPGPTGSGPWEAGTGWRPAGMPRVFRVSSTAGERRIEIVRRADDWVGTVDGEQVQVRVVSVMADGLVLHRDRRVLRFGIEARADRLEIAYSGRLYRVGKGAPQLSGPRVRVAGDVGATAPIPGTVVKVAVVEGQHVTAHEPLVVLEAMKMEHVVEAPHEGVVTEVLVKEGDLLPAGSPVVRIEAE